MFILFILLLLIIDEPTAKLATFLMLSSTDACRKCWSSGRRRVNYSKILSSSQLKLLLALSTVREAIQYPVSWPTPTLTNPSLEKIFR